MQRQKKKYFLLQIKENFFNIFNQIREIEKNFKKDNIIIEPKSLNTAPAIALAVKFFKNNTAIASDEPILVLPSDHHIKNKSSFLNILKISAEKIKDKIAAIGIIPKKAETGYGYIKKRRRWMDILE